LENRPVVICLNDPDLVEVLMNHLMEKGVTKIVSSYVEVTANVDGRGVAVVAEVPSASSDPQRDLVEYAAEVLLIELIKPQS
jgi:hypothetical protein